MGDQLASTHLLEDHTVGYSLAELVVECRFNRRPCENVTEAGLKKLKIKIKLLIIYFINNYIFVIFFSLF
jgi:hypothetical protein